MKKLFYFAAAALLSLAVSCQKETLEPVSDSTVTFTVEVPGLAGVKSIGDGMNVNEVHYAVYKAGSEHANAVQNPSGTPLVLGKVDMVSGKASVNFDLLKNQDYVAIFWAQVAGKNYYNLGDLRTISLADAAKTAGNAEDRAAFFRTYSFNTNVAKDYSIDLRRPFAQLNIGTTKESLTPTAEGQTSAAYTIDVQKSTVKVTGLATTFNTIDGLGRDEYPGAAGDPVTAEFTFSEALQPAQDLEVVSGGVKSYYEYVAMNYMFVNGNINVSYEIVTDKGTVTNSVESVSVEENIRTHLIGNLLTSNVEIDIIVDPEWDDEAIILGVNTVATADDLQAAIDAVPAGTEGYIKLEDNIDLNDLAAFVKAAQPYGVTIPAGKTLTLDLNGMTLSQKVNQAGAYSMIQNNGTLTIMDSKGNGKITYGDTGNGGNYVSNTIANNGIMIIESGIIENNSAATVAANGFPHPIDNNGTLTINGGTLTNNADYASMRIWCTTDDNTSVTINGGTFNGSIDFQTPNAAANKGTLTINGGTFNADTYTKSAVRLLGFGADVDEMLGYIKGGEFNGSVKIGNYCGQEMNAQVFYISGGVFSENPSEFLANGFVAEQNEESKWIIVAAPAAVDGGYEISNVAQLKYLAESINSGENTYNTNIKLAADIDLNNEQWIPIGVPEEGFTGTPNNKFTGSFDGQGHTIKNLNIVVSEAKEGKAYIGLFGYAKDATFKNLVLENVNLNVACLDIDHSQGHIGALAGSLEGNSTIENVTVKGDIKVEATFDANGASRVAVVAGGNSYGNVTMKNVHVVANNGSYLKANNNVGALAGQLQNKSVFENCSSNIDVTGKKFFAGGIIGLAAGDQVFTDCHTTGDITITAGREGRANDQYRVGGIAGGWADGKTKVCTLTGCTYSGKVYGANADGSVAEVLDYAGYVGRGYTLANCAGSKVIIDGTSYIQNYDDRYGIYTVLAEGYEFISPGLGKNTTTYAVSSSEGLVSMSKTAIKGGESVILTADIDLAGVEFGGLTAFNPGKNNTFDGQGHKVSNWTYTGGASDMAFIKSWVGLIKNVTIENASLKTAGRSAVLAANVYTDIENCHVVNSTIEDSYWACGVVAGLYNSGSITNCSVVGCSVKSNGGVGGIVGVINESSGERKIENCTVKNTTVNNTGVYGEEYSGALIAGIFNANNATYKFNNCVLENNTKAGSYVGDLFYTAEGSTVFVDGVQQ